MRFLPYVLVAGMAAPVIAWMLIEKFMVKGTATHWTAGDAVSLGSLSVFMLVAFWLLSRWMDKFITRTGG